MLLEPVPVIFSIKFSILIVELCPVEDTCLLFCRRLLLSSITFTLAVSVKIARIYTNPYHLQCRLNKWHLKCYSI